MKRVKKFGLAIKNGAIAENKLIHFKPEEFLKHLNFLNIQHLFTNKQNKCKRGQSYDFKNSDSSV